MSRVYFEDEAWNEYVFWQIQNRKTAQKINELIKEIGRNEYEGLGKPERLKGDKRGYWSRRIDNKNRLLYKIENGVVIITKCKSHYGDK